jgi:hypothetical protein
MEVTSTDNGLTLNIDNKEIVAVRISVGKYSNASITVSPGKDEYFDMIYEWYDTDAIPTLVLELLSLIKNKNEKASFDNKDGFIYKNEDLYEEYVSFKDKNKE